MKEMIHLALKTGYSFRQVFGHIDKTMEFHREGAIGIADLTNTFSHYEIEMACKEKNKEKEILKPIYGVRLNVVEHGGEKVKPRGQFGPEYIFIAKNEDGLKEIYNLVKINYENFYYRGNLSFRDVTSLSKNVIVIAEDVQDTKRLDYIALTTTTPNYMYEVGVEEKIPFVAIVNNFFPEKGDYETYELLVGSRNSCLQTYPQHILSTQEWYDFQKSKKREHGFLIEAIDNTHEISKSVKHIILPKAPMIKSKGKTKIEYLCKIGARKKKINITEGEYADRYNREMELIKDRGFDDYFIVVADMISKAKKKMLVGPGRGSSGGSLVCYIMGITEVDPIVHGLMFERFIDVTRFDLPDIDIDFPDSTRDKVIKDLTKEYGNDKVKHIANVTTMKSKSAIGNFAKGLGIPPSETETIKNAIIERSGGDIRSKHCMEDTFKTTDVGKTFVEKYPAMELVARVESHPYNSSVHAAGIIVCNDPVHFYGGTNERDNTVMTNKYGAEYLNLLKIDVLGLRTLAVLGDCAKMVGMSHMDLYDLPLDDDLVYKTFNDHRLNGIFQFEGHSLATLTKKMGIHIFEDIVAITSLARPGALYSGGASRYVKYRLGEDNPVYYGEKHREITEATYGIVVFQEQILRICREIGSMSWADVNILRRGLSKSYGEAFFAGYKEKYMKGAIENGYTEEGAEFIWGEVCYGGNYAFNRSHAVAYGLVSYWTAYMKSHYPLEFVVSCLNNEKDEESSVKILRDAIEHDDIEYDPIDPDNSGLYWSVVERETEADGQMITEKIIVGGLTNIKGIGVSKARKIIKSRTGEEELTPSLYKALISPKTPFDHLYPTKRYFGDIYDNPEKYGLSKAPDFIKDVDKIGKFTFIGQLRMKNVRDLNEFVNLQKRGGKVLKSHTIELAIKVEDDTDSIMAGIGRFEYEKIGREIAELGVVDEDYFIIMGEIRGENSRYVRVKNIMKIKPEEFGFVEDNY